MTPPASPPQPLWADTGAGGTEGWGSSGKIERDMVRMHVHVDHWSALLRRKCGVREARKHD